jgi:cystathionine beta-lyase/cystathionine gamma-synthase
LRDRPIQRGADLVVHSVTKFIGGHHDVLAGAVVGSAEWVQQARLVAVRFGLTAAPLDAWLAVRGLRSLHVRMERAWQTAAEVARRLRGHRAVRKVHATSRCALVSFDLGGRQVAERMVAAARYFPLSPSLGGVITTLAHPATSSHAALSAEQRARAGIGDGLVRMCVGLEDADDLWLELENALAAAPAA